MTFFLRVTMMVLAVIGLTGAGCPPLWTRYGDNCYRFMGPELSWSDAENHCQKFFTISGQGHLASVHSSAENNFLVQYLESSLVSDSKHVWIGLSDQFIEGVFRWSDGTAMLYAGWKDGQPSNANEDCVEFQNHVSGWDDSSCTSTHPHICKMPLPGAVSE